MKYRGLKLGVGALMLVMIYALLLIAASGCTSTSSVVDPKCVIVMPRTVTDTLVATDGTVVVRKVQYPLMTECK